jgi:hypothetical protein
MNRFLAFYALLVITQVGHFLEHVAQMVQIHWLGYPAHHAHGILGSVLDTEWVHFIFNAWVLIAVVLLLFHYRRNPWLWLTLLIAGWHQIEHTYIMSVYLATGLERTPGLLAIGGALGGGLSLSRPDLHFYYNLVETVPLVIGFIYQWRCASGKKVTAVYAHFLKR